MTSLFSCSDLAQRALCEAAILLRPAAEMVLGFRGLLPAYDFAKDKPTTLLSGSELLNLLAQHGHQARIDLAEARKGERERSRDTNMHGLSSDPKELA
jgi:hypothetical protein